MVSTDQQLARFAFEAYHAAPGGNRWPGRRWHQLSDHERARWAQVGATMRDTVLTEHEIITGGTFTCPVDGLYMATTHATADGKPPQMGIRLIARTGQRCPTCGVQVRQLPDWDAPPEPPAGNHRQVVFDTVPVDGV